MKQKQIRKKINNLYKKKERLLQEYYDHLNETEEQIKKIQEFCNHPKTQKNTFTYDTSLVCCICDKVLEENRKF